MRSHNNNTFKSLNAHLPCSQACENNKQAILEVLEKELAGRLHVLEVGSGTGQHSIYFAARLAHLQWQTSDVLANHEGIKAWHHAYPADNVIAPIVFDLLSDASPFDKATSIDDKRYDAVFTANTLHIIAWSLVEKLFALVGESLPEDGKFVVYGPFNENGSYTSEGNRQFDMMLRQSDAKMGIRDREDVIVLAKKNKLTLSQIYSMPANNQLLAFVKTVAD
ncbi:MAG: class I SAM-dependent methyltransferase [Psychrobacter sp.]|nr:class I SAM-dependent methyltransferase [Psychrobacter sp.]